MCVMVMSGAFQMTQAPAGAVAPAGGLAAAQRDSQNATQDLDLVQITAAVVDRKGKPIKGLRRDDFSVREDGKPVEIATFSEHTPVPGDPDTNRTLVLLLDDAGVAPVGTQTIQAIANAFVEVADPADDVVVVRLHGRNDEPYGDRLEARARIRDYRAGAMPWVAWSTGEELLAKVSDISRHVAGNTSPRKTLVCIGSSFVCNVGQPQSSAPRPYERAWLSALREASLADLVVYSLIPMRTTFRSGGLADLTGGDVLTPTSDAGPAIEQILAEASNYYVIGYWPRGEVRTPHRIEVKVAMKGARVHARKAR